MNFFEYWKKRESLWQEQQMKNDKDRMEEIKKRLQYAQDEIQKEINANWNNFTDGQKVSISEAMKSASKLDVAAFARKAKKYVETKDFSSRANRELKLYNVTMRVNRLELLKANIGLELVSVFDEMDKYFVSQLSAAASEEMKRQAGILGLSIPDEQNAALIATVVDSSFNTKGFPVFGDSLWQYQSELKADLDKLLVRSVTQGVNPKALAPQLKRYLTEEGKENARSNTQRLMITETTRVQTSIQKESYKKADIDKYQFIAEPNACRICMPLNGKVFDLKDMQLGLNAPNMHPYCKCSTAPYVDDRAFYDDLLKRGVISKEEYKQAFEDRAEAEAAINKIVQERKMKKKI